VVTVKNAQEGSGEWFVTSGEEKNNRSGVEGLSPLNTARNGSSDAKTTKNVSAGTVDLVEMGSGPSQLRVNDAGPLRRRERPRHLADLKFGPLHQPEEEAKQVASHV
jgi:hypothetical protein